MNWRKELFRAVLFNAIMVGLIYDGKDIQAILVWIGYLLILILEELFKIKMILKFGDRDD